MQNSEFLSKPVMEAKKSQNGSLLLCIVSTFVKNYTQSCYADICHRQELC